MSLKTEIEDFLDGPLVSWVKSCLHDPSSLSDYDDLVDGLLVYQVLLLIDPEPLYHGVTPSLGNPILRTKNWDCIIKNIKALYEEELGQYLIVLPDASRLGKECDTRAGLEEMQLVLLLLLGCAVQCPNKQVFIERIKTLPIESQHSLVDCIKQVTESQELVLTQEGSENAPHDLLLKHLKNLLKQRDQIWIVASALATQSEGETKKQQNQKDSTVVRPESQHLAVELADWKAKLRKQRQELEEKSEALSEVKEELEFNKSLVTKLKNEVNDLKTEARVGKAYRDEADALREKAERAERLEAEVARYKERLSDLEYYKSRVEELRQDKRVLEETREMLEEQLSRARARVEYTAQLEATLLSHKQTINDLSLEREATQEKLQDLFEENAQLALLSKSALNHDNSILDDNLDEEGLVNEGDNSLSEQLSSNAQARALRLELENRRLAETVESLQEAALMQTNERILELEKEKKKLSIQVDELEENKRKLTAHINELETTVKNAQRDTKKMQDIRDSIQNQLQLRTEEVESITREKSRWEARTNEAEVRLREKERQLEDSQDLKAKVDSLNKEVTRLKAVVEEKSVDIDKLQCELDACLKEKSLLTKRLDEANSQIVRLNEVEKNWKDLESQYQVDKATLKTLQDDLVAEMLVSQQLKSSLGQLGLAVDQLSDPDSVVDKMLSNSEIMRAVRVKLNVPQEDESNSRALNELQEENARLSVSLSTLQSQIRSLTSQQTAQKLANSQLAAEKEDSCKKMDALREQVRELLVDQLTLQRLHEQLTTQYETMQKERDNGKLETKRVRQEARELRESYERLEGQIATLQTELERSRTEASSLVNLRGEHSKLKEDFRHLFTASEKVKCEYRVAQEEYKSMKAEVRAMSLSQTELQGELAAKTDLIRDLELQVANLSNDCLMLRQMLATFEDDRKSLMDHVSLLLGQYHSLLTHSLEDKEHFHMEEKNFTDKLNHLSRQKEKLEEKIMEQYRKMESMPPKKKGFGASLVRKVRKAGSDLINKSRRSWNEDAIRRSLSSQPNDINGTDSDTSLEEIRTRQDGLSLGSAGTRRTVYVSGDETGSQNTTNDQDDRSQTLPAELPRSSTPHQDPSILVYNRVTALVGGGTPPLPQSPSNSSQMTRKSQGSSKKSSWHEYGCV